MTTAAFQTSTDTDDCAHVDERAALLTERATEYVTSDGLDPFGWHVVDIAREIAADCGLPVTRAEIAYRMLEIAEAKAIAWLKAEAEFDEDAEDAGADYYRDVRGTARGLMSGIAVDDEGATSGRWWVRRWLRDQGISAEGRCRGCEGGHAGLCPACQAANLGPALVMSVAITADRKVA